jgi:thiol-disulfide isomerase/thioredoxin
MGKDQNFELKTDTQEGYIRNLQVIGDDENERYAGYKRSSIDFSADVKKLRAKLKKDPSNKKLIEQRKKLYKSRTEYMKNFISVNKNDVFSKYMLAIKPLDVPELKKENGDLDTFGRYLYYKNHYWDNFSFQEECLVRTPDEWLPRKITDYMSNLLYQHPDTAIKYADALLAKTKGNKEVDKYFIFKITQIYDTMQLMCMDKVFVHMVDKYYSTPRAYWVDSGTRARMVESAEKRRYTTCGATALNLNYYNLDSIPQQLYRNRGKYTIVVFYDPTCGHCKSELPIVHELYSRKKSEGWTVYAIAAMNKKKEWKKYILEDNPTWTDWVNVCDVVPYRNWVDNRTAYNITANPTILILNSQGQIIAKRIPAKNIEGFVAEYERIFGSPK